MVENLPYCTSVGTLEKMLEKIRDASVPERFTQDFVSTKLAMKGGTPMSVIPFIKKMRFVGSDGIPTELYREFRNPAKSRITMARAFRKLYERLYEMNEYVHDATDHEVKGLITQCTGAQKDSAVGKYTLSTFNTLRKLSDFDSSQTQEKDVEKEAQPTISSMPLSLPSSGQLPIVGTKSLNLSYTINLNLPATKDIEVFNAIFKSIKEHLLKE